MLLRIVHGVCLILMFAIVHIFQQQPSFTTCLHRLPNHRRLVLPTVVLVQDRLWRALYSTPPAGHSDVMSSIPHLPRHHNVLSYSSLPVLRYRFFSLLSPCTFDDLVGQDQTARGAGIGLDMKTLTGPSQPLQVANATVRTSVLPNHRAPSELTTKSPHPR